MTEDAAASATGPAWLGQVARFALVGGLAFILDAGILWLTLRAGASPYAGRVLSIAVSIVFTWWLNRRLTFTTAAGPSWREFGAYALQSLLGAAINYGVYSAAIAAGAPVLAGLVLGTGIAAVVNFFRYRAILG
ncbi:MAG: GtrA family protein [Sphingomonadaceae bacterium]|nr:GtrA family protein [Sphingomonadaceae bacterium]